VLGLVASSCALGVGIRRPALATLKSARAYGRGESTVLVRMKARYEDGDDRRLSQGGSGGRWGRTAKSRGGSFGAYTNTEGRRSGGLESQQIRKAKLDAYIDNDLDPTDGTIGKIIAGSLLFAIFAGLLGIMMYYGTDGLAAATYNQRAVRGM